MVVANLVALRPEFTTSTGDSSVWICAYDPQLFDSGPLASDLRLALQKNANGKTHLVTSSYLERHIELHFPDPVVVQTITVSTKVASRFRGRWNIDLAVSRIVTETGNVSTTLMLPLAASLGRTIVLYGMDGFARRSERVETHYYAAFQTDNLESLKQIPLSQKRASGSDLLRELDVFEFSSSGLVQAMLARGHRVFLTRPSLNRGSQDCLPSTARKSERSCT